MGEKDPHIFVVDDDGSVRTALSRLLKACGFKVQTFRSAEDFLDSGFVRHTGVLILDVRMAGMSGLELQKRLSEMGSEMPIIFITAHDDIQSRTKAMEAGAVAFLQKPFDEQRLLDAIHRAFDPRPGGVTGLGSFA
jgi:two-component system, LuxR family, response regulator FixJ